MNEKDERACPYPSTSMAVVTVKVEASSDSSIAIPQPQPSSSFKYFSKNCKKFNKLFHFSFDEDSSSSSNSDQDLFDSKGHVRIKSEQPEILLEIEIETENFDELEEHDETLEKKQSSITNLFEAQMKAEADSSATEIPDEGGTKKGNGTASTKTRKLSKSKRTDVRIGQRKSNRLPQKSMSCKTHEAQIMRRITVILKKEASIVTEEDQVLLDAFPTLVRIVKKRFEARLISTERLKEFEDSEEVLEEKCNELADVISRAKYLVVYSGAGISTSANIPDFRGTMGLWTMLKNGQALESQTLDTQILTSADPTPTHMALKQLYSDGIVKHIVSQNCDGLHLRSGIPRMGLSEIHGNMYIEVCVKCGRDYARIFDVTENTRRHEHRTGRRCYHCRSPLRDTIVHFGERGKLRWPINWAGAEYNANRADVILCIGSSLKVLRRYPWLWCMDKPATKRPKLVIVNLMWTPKDQFAALKIHGRCDDVMTRVMRKLNMNIPTYSRLGDPLFQIATPLHHNELRSRPSRELAFPENEPFPIKLMELNNYIQFEPVFRLSSNSSSDEESETADKSTPGGKGKLKGVKTRATLSKSKTGGVSIKDVKSDKKNRIIKKGSGNGWLGNLTPGVKMRKRKLK